MRVRSLERSSAGRSWGVHDRVARTGLVWECGARLAGGVSGSGRVLVFYAVAFGCLFAWLVSVAACEREDVQTE
jgi:hypothetical protein